MRLINKKINFAFGLLVIIGLLSFSMLNDTVKSYKCMVQLKNYSGPEAYVVVSLINPEGSYEKTLWMMGEDEDWYEYFEKWWVFNEKKQEDIDAVSGESITGGERKVITFNIDENKLNKGYSIRFESAVEEQKYYEKDVETIFSGENINKKIEGKGYIKYIQITSK